MKYGIYVLKDDKTCWLTPHVDINDASAIRNFRQAITNKDSNLNFAPADFGLYKIGEYDSSNGCIEVESCPVLLMRGDDV